MIYLFGAYGFALLIIFVLWLLFWLNNSDGASVGIINLFAGIAMFVVTFVVGVVCMIVKLFELFFC